MKLSLTPSRSECGTECLWNAKRVAAYLDVPVKRVYSLPIPRVRLGDGTYRWDPADVKEYVLARKEGF